ncbi:TauD/TfdA dioxygenase family protein [Brevundimonas sp. SL130]|uniref:TauD/TfdA dioxygenase family protein n=1 Tax=Brevundimonas sp. SL130 TaxID=2995143 RepID=UPI00226D1AF7|nr:TauD/TfdA family dioxygenase [Brevundimonas sp. SL130]WAC58494.1 TauD/TfdA family dioxygenase [Brevundimonas sp. SL130]
MTQSAVELSRQDQVAPASAGATKPYSTITVEPVTLRIGAEISGIDLTKPIGEAQKIELRRALADHLVIFFRDQPINHEQHMALGRAFSELIVHPGAPGIEDHPLIVAIHADASSKYVAGESWHSDLSCNAEPPLGSILRLHTVPECGGDTMFASMYAAYEALSDRMKTYLEGLTAEHDANHVYHALYKDYETTYPRNNHPVVITHPVTGRKALFVNSSYTTKINELSDNESQAVLAYLYDHCANPNFHVRFRWRPNSIAFWDNRCTHHLAVWDYFPQTRSGFRVTLKGERPVF